MNEEGLECNTATQKENQNSLTTKDTLTGD